MAAAIAFAGFKSPKAETILLKPYANTVNTAAMAIVVSNCINPTGFTNPKI